MICANLFQRILNSLSQSENTPKVFNHIRYWRIMTLSVHGNNGDFRVFFLNKVVSEDAKSILACTENTLKAFQLLRRIRQEYSTGFF
jgi:hypothetical protein